MPEPKTRPTNASVEKFLESLTDEEKREDSRVIIKLMSEATGDKPVMWGTSIVGFGSQHLKYATGRELDWPIAAFSPRKQNLTLYVLDYTDKYDKLLTNLGKHSKGKSCLYIKRLSDVNLDVLKQIIELSAKSPGLA